MLYIIAPTHSDALKIAKAIRDGIVICPEHYRSSQSAQAFLDRYPRGGSAYRVWAVGDAEPDPSPSTSTFTEAVASFGMTFILIVGTAVGSLWEGVV